MSQFYNPGYVRKLTEDLARLGCNQNDIDQELFKYQQQIHWSFWKLPATSMKVLIVNKNFKIYMSGTPEYGSPMKGEDLITLELAERTPNKDMIIHTVSKSKLNDIEQGIIALIDKYNRQNHDHRDLIIEEYTLMRLIYSQK